MVTVPLTWRGPLDGWAQWLIAAGRPATTRYLRDYQVRRFAAAHVDDPWEVTTDDLITWLAAQDWSAETRRGYRSALRSFYSWGHVTGRVAADPAALLPTVTPPRRLPRPAPEAILLETLARADDRVRLMVLLAGRQGLRRGEIAQVHSDDLEEDILGWSLRVRGKGAKERRVPLNDEVARALRTWPRGWAFPGRIDGHLSPARVGELVSAALGPGWTTHTLRHRFATIAYAGDRDLLAVQELLGHSKPETTRQYVQLPDDALRRAVLRAAA